MASQDPDGPWLLFDPDFIKTWRTQLRLAHRGLQGYLDPEEARMQPRGLTQQQASVLRRPLETLQIVINGLRDLVRPDELQPGNTGRMRERKRKRADDDAAAAAAAAAVTRGPQDDQRRDASDSDPAPPRRRARGRPNMLTARLSGIAAAELLAAAAATASATATDATLTRATTTAAANAAPTNAAPTNTAVPVTAVTRTTRAGRATRVPGRYNTM